MRSRLHCRILCIEPLACASPTLFIIRIVGTYGEHAVLPAAVFKTPLADHPKDRDDRERNERAEKIHAAKNILLYLHTDRHWLLPVLPRSLNTKRVFAARQRRQCRVLFL